MISSQTGQNVEFLHSRDGLIPSFCSLLHRSDIKVVDRAVPGVPCITVGFSSSVNSGIIPVLV